jgi:hypothetical protein
MRLNTWPAGVESTTRADLSKFTHVPRIPEGSVHRFAGIGSRLKVLLDGQE